MTGQRALLILTLILASVVGGAVSNLFLIARLSAGQTEVITASQINIVDGGGRLRMVLAGEDERGLASVAFYGPGGLLRGVIGVESDGTPVLRLNDTAGVGQMSMRVTDDESVVVVGDEATRSTLISSVDGNPVIRLSDRGRTRLQLDLGGEAQPRLSLFSSTGQRGIGLVVGSDDAPFVSLFDVDGAQRLTMGTVQGSTVVNLNDDSRPRLVLGVADNGRASVAFYDAEGALERDVSGDVLR